jgi:hypothetical protein
MTDSQPMSVSDALGNDGPLPEVRYKGEVYKVAHPCPEVIGHAEELVISLSWQQLKRCEKILPPDEYGKLRAETVAAVQTRQNAYGSPLFSGTLAGPDGDVLILYSCLKVHHPHLTADVVREMMRADESADDIELALARVSPGFFLSAADTAVKPRRERAAAGLAMAAQAAAVLAQRAASRPTSPPTPV